MASDTVLVFYLPLIQVGAFVAAWCAAMITGVMFHVAR